MQATFLRTVHHSGAAYRLYQVDTPVTYKDKDNFDTSTNHVIVRVHYTRSLAITWVDIFAANENGDILLYTSLEFLDFAGVCDVAVACEQVLLRFGYTVNQEQQ